MFIDGNSSSKQRQNSAPLRPTDTNSNNTNSTSRRKSRKPIKNLQESINNNENKTSQIDEDTQSISFIDEDDQIPTHSLNNNNTTYNDQISLPNDGDDDDESHSNTTVSFFQNYSFLSKENLKSNWLYQSLFKDISRRVL